MTKNIIFIKINKKINKRDFQDLQKAKRFSKTFVAPERNNEWTKNNPKIIILDDIKVHNIRGTK